MPKDFMFSFLHSPNTNIKLNAKETELFSYSIYSLLFLGLCSQGGPWVSFKL